ncbi:beta strand repeat-containing protein [Alicyclobacillus macrosporangiidus]|uniref:beta strand repeat-containing protein n=1 Tax=Alicyclobacillus macrosporangiidus TaxID=392015 RepID=UPI0004955400|nr:hypothetical protein [Alicyclobacillus macrosporangiidus]
MKRALTGIAAASLVLGAMTPAAFAGTTTNNSATVAGTKPVVVNGNTISNPYVLTALDSGNVTAYFGIYYFNQALKAAGYQAFWDGNTHTWNIVAPNIDPSKVSVAGGLGTGNTTISINGVPVKKINTFSHKDPAGGSQETTYFPVYYVNNVFKAIGFSASWDGSQGLTVTSPANVVNGAALSTPTLTGQTVGSGQQTSPAINESGGTITVSTKLTDANGNAVANASLSLTFTGSTVQPTVQQGNTFASIGGNATDGYTATVTTDSTGTATFTVGGIGSYELEIDAPYSNNGKTVSQTVYVGFVNDDAILTPSGDYSADTSSASNPTAGLVPVTVTLPEINNKPAAGQQVTFVLAQANTGAGATTLGNLHAFFANSSGASISANNYYTTYTDANGQATVWVNDYNEENVYVNVWQGASASGNPAASTEISYSNPAAPSTSLASIGVSAFQPTSSYTPTDTSVSGLPGDQEVYFVPLDASGDEITGTDAEITYIISASNGAKISEINGVALPAQVGTPSTVQLALTDYSSGTYTWKVDGLPLGTTSVPYFYVNLTNVAANGTTLTVTSGSAKATATFNSAVTPSYASTFTPTTVGLNSFTGQSGNVTFTVLDANGNPVANNSAQIKLGSAATNVWITAVNGAALVQNEGTNGTEPTPIPLYYVTTPQPVAYASGLSIPGVVTWTGQTAMDLGTITVFTNSQGQVTLTLQSGNVSYWGGSGSSYSVQNSGSQSTTNGYTYAFTYGDGNTGNHEVLYFGNSLDPSWGGTGYQVGTIKW